MDLTNSDEEQADGASGAKTGRQPSRVSARQRGKTADEPEQAAASIIAESNISEQGKAAAKKVLALTNATERRRGGAGNGQA